MVARDVDLPPGTKCQPRTQDDPIVVVGNSRTFRTALSRTIAADQRYADLKYAGSATWTEELVVPADPSRRIFEEFYSFHVGGELEDRSVVGAEMLARVRRH